MPDRRKKTGYSAAKIARGAVITALCAALLLLSYPFESLDFVVATLAAMLVWIIRLEYGSGFSLLVYVAASLLSFILAPGATGVVCFGIIFGWYPVVKVIIERHVPKKLLQMLIKVLIVTVAFALMLSVFFNVFIGEMTFESFAEELSSFFSLDAAYAGWLEEQGLFGLNRLQWLMISAYLILAPLMALIFDLLLTKFAIVYMYRIRPLLVKAHVFGDKAGKY
ncbi:MAG: hypothetical protein IJU52_07130 [Clostridia bacterium]|nr:hypothetical protein [Clostridia bacterium]